jgi:SPP1 family predicted phage head-tail adaptor
MRDTSRIGAGKYNTRVKIEKPTDSVGTIGDAQLTWTKFCDRWAAVDSTNGREYQQAMTIIADLAAIVRMRYDSQTAEITPRMRLVKGSRVWNIASATNQREENKEIVLYCTEVVA